MTLLRDYRTSQLLLCAPEASDFAVAQHMIASQREAFRVTRDVLAMCAERPALRNILLAARFV